jgi:ABC-type phosphate/phosphonate transport system substrate-binding protein
LLPFFERRWTYGVDDPEIWRESGEPAIRTEEGRTFVGGDPADGGYRILDARSAANETSPDIFENTRILLLTDQIPNDSISFGPEFPLNTANVIVSYLEEWVTEDNPDCMASICSDDFFTWTGIEPTNDSFYDPVRDAMDALGITEEEILGG